MQPQMKKFSIKTTKNKTIDFYLEHFKILGDYIQHIMSLHSKIDLLACAGTDGIVEIPSF